MESFVQHIGFLKKVATKIRIDTLEALHEAGSGNLGGALSAIDLITAMYFGEIYGVPIMRFDPNKPQWDAQDYFVLSKGHAAIGWYSLLANIGFFDLSELKFYRKTGALLQAFPNKKIPGVILPSGLPAYGFGAGVGLAIGLKQERASNRVFVLCGDGELQTGAFWEACLMASQHKLDNLTLVIDMNDMQMDGFIKGSNAIDPVQEKFEAFGFKAINVTDGHDFDKILAGFEKALEIKRKPCVLLCKTVKGKGVLFAEDKPSYHAASLSKAELKEALPRLKEYMVNPA